MHPDGREPLIIAVMSSFIADLSNAEQDPPRNRHHSWDDIHSAITASSHRRDLPEDKGGLWREVKQAWTFNRECDVIPFDSVKCNYDAAGFHPPEVSPDSEPLAVETTSAIDRMACSAFISHTTGIVVAGNYIMILALDDVLIMLQIIFSMSGGMMPNP
jgi:hypothetical protein